MDTLKMKFKLNSLEFEIEGNEDTVKTEFENFKGFVSNELLPKLNFTAPANVPAIAVNGQATPSIKQLGIQSNNSVSNIDIPSLKEVVKRDLPKSESDWC